MPDHNLRHLRLFADVAAQHSATGAALRLNLSQPAVTQAMAALERRMGAPLLERTRNGLFPTIAGGLFASRVERALGLLDDAAETVAPRLRLTATAAQLRALIALADAENFTLAARQMGCAQPTVHRAVTSLQMDAERPLFQRTARGVSPTRAGETLARGARLMFAELAQADAELGEAVGREVGRIVVGALPLSRSHALPRALTRFRARRPTLAVRIVDGRYDELLRGLRRGEIDFLIGALRDPSPIEDVEQARLFDDTLALVARPGHPLADRAAPPLEALALYPWVVNVEGTPSRSHFDRLMGPLGEAAPRSVIETPSLILMREILLGSDHLGCVSRLQADAEIGHGLLTMLDMALTDTRRAIGVTTRRGWRPTPAQRALLDLLQDRDEPL